jgi:hypothetical protein
MYVERFSKLKKYFIFKTHCATRGVKNVYSAGVVTQDRMIEPRSQSYYVHLNLQLQRQRCT